MSFKVTNDVVIPSDQNSYDNIKPSGAFNDAAPKIEPPKDECIIIGSAGSETLSIICRPVGKNSLFSPNESQAEKELFCDMITQAMEDGQDVPFGWILACEEVLKEE